MNSTLCFSTGTILGVLVGIVVLSKPPEAGGEHEPVQLMATPDPITVPLHKNIIVGSEIPQPQPVTVTAKHKSKPKR